MSDKVPEVQFSLRLDDRVVVVTGAAQGIGRAYALGLAVAGAAVVVVDIDDAGAADVVRQIEAAGGTAVARHTDVADPEQVERLADDVGQRFGRVDGLVNNAAVDGAPRATPLVDLEPADYDRVMAVNVKGMWLVTRALLPLLAKSAHGAVVNQGSIGAFLASAGYLPYITSKTAIIGLTKTLARELGPLGVRVNSLAPGSIATDSVFRSLDQETIDAIVSSQCIQVHLQPEDLLGPLLFLLGGASRFMSGQTIVVDGGGVMLP